jgi:hypothetical protein
MSKKIFISATLTALILMSLGWYAFNRTSSLAPASLNPEVLISASPRPVSALSETFASTQFGFSFNYPKEFTSSVISDDPSAVTIVVQENEKRGFQIYISPFNDTDTIITAERIKQDIPDMVILEPQEVALTEESKGVAFISQDLEDTSKHREVWFVYKSNLYQITATLEIDELLKAIVNTWKFQR